MADLFIDADVTARSQERLRSISDLLDKPCRAMRNLPKDAVDQARLRAKLEDFGDEWSWGIGKLGEFSGSAAEALGQILQAFDDADQELKAKLESAAEQAK